MSPDRAFASLQNLELTDAEVASALNRFDARPRARRGFGGVSLAFVSVPLLALMAAAVALAVPASRAALDGALERFFAGGPPPGEPIPHEEMPAWLRDLERETGTRARPHVLARSGEVELVAYRAPSGAICFDFDARVGVCIPQEGEGAGVEAFFSGEFEGKPVTLWGPTHRDDEGRWILFGVALDSVRRVELRYEDGEPTSTTVTNGFIIRAESTRSPRELVVFDGKRQELARLDVVRRFEIAPVGG